MVYTMNLFIQGVELLATLAYFVHLKANVCKRGIRRFIAKLIGLT